MDKNYTGEYLFELNDDQSSYNAELVLAAARLVLPSEHLGMPVTRVWAGEIGAENRLEVKEVVVPQGIDSLEGALFECFSSLVSISLPESLDYLGSECIVGCPSLREISVDPENKKYKSIDGSLYSKDGSVLVRVADGRVGSCFELPSGVVSIADNAFRGCHTLSRVRLPDTLAEIGASAFSECVSLERVSLPRGLERIGNFAFSGCRSLSKISIPDTVERIGHDLFMGASENICICCEKDVPGGSWEDDWCGETARAFFGLKT